VLALELLGSAHGATAGLLALGALAVVLIALHRLVPVGTLVARRGLPAVIGTRGLMSGAFFCAQAYIVFVLQEQWSLTPARAGLSLTLVGVVWATSSQLQARLGTRVSHVSAMRWGSRLVLAGATALGLVVWTHAHPALAIAAYVVAGAGMGFGYPRTSVAMLDASTDRDRGFNSSAISIADSLGAALALSAAGVAFGAADRAGADPFLSVFAVAIVIAALATATAARTQDVR
jgi:predicted MFS family arabinose efflux permease